MKWPRGRYNGMRIIGLEVKFKLCFTTWRWKPFIGGYCGGLHWGPFMSWWGFDYDQFEDFRKRRQELMEGTTP